MNPTTEDGGKEQRLLRHARREGLLIMAAWTLALIDRARQAIGDGGMAALRAEVSLTWNL